MKISLDELSYLPGQRLTFNFKEELRATAAVKPVVGELSISLNASGVKLTGHLVTLLKLRCDRCLAPFFHSLSLDLDERFVSRQFLEKENKERELRLDDFVEALPEDGILDIGDIVFQSVTLATPAYCLCGSECPGPPKMASIKEDSTTRYSIDEKSGAIAAESDLPDPRWRNLKTLFPKTETSENS
jgi:uncharacterized metal-binding protein YceD (DUF177 family)